MIAFRGESHLAAPLRAIFGRGLTRIRATPDCLQHSCAPASASSNGFEVRLRISRNARLKRPSLYSAQTCCCASISPRRNHVASTASSLLKLGEWRYAAFARPYLVFQASTDATPKKERIPDMASASESGFRIAPRFTSSATGNRFNHATDLAAAADSAFRARCS